MALPDGSDIAPLLKRADREVYQTKVVVRRLPPSLTSSELLDRLSPLPSYDYFYVAKPDLSLGPVAFSRAYFNFRRFDDVITFRNRVDGFVFLDQGGRKYPAVVEFAPLQKIPHQRKGAKDHKCGTIGTDKDYKSFIATLEAEVPSLPNAEARLEEIEARKQQQTVDSTPLVEFIRRKHQSSKSVSKYPSSSSKADTSRLRDKRKKDDSTKPDKKTQMQAKPSGSRKDVKSKPSDTDATVDQRPSSGKPSRKGPIRQDERKDLKSKDKRGPRPDSRKSGLLDEEQTIPKSKPKSSGGFATHEQDWPSLTQTKLNDPSSQSKPTSAKIEDTTRQPSDAGACVKSGEGRKSRDRPGQDLYVPKAARVPQDRQSTEQEQHGKPRGRGRGRGGRGRYSGPNV